MLRKNSFSTFLRRPKKIQKTCINKIIKSLNPNKATVSDRITAKIIKTAAIVIDSHLAYIINKDLKENKFSSNAKTPLVKLNWKKDHRDKIKN